MQALQAIEARGQQRTEHVREGKDETMNARFYIFSVCYHFFFRDPAKFFCDSVSAVDGLTFSSGLDHVF